MSVALYVGIGFGFVFGTIFGISLTYALEYKRGVEIGKICDKTSIPPKRKKVVWNEYLENNTM